LDCEKHINNYETYSADLLRDVDNYRTIDNQAIEIPGFDYKKFKLFGLSLIWRSHISNLFFFSGVNLGPHAEKIRKMILLENPGKPKEYCFSLLKIDGATSAKRIMHAPTKVKVDGQNAYVFLAYGFEWIYVISSHSGNLPDDYPLIGITPELVILIDHIPQGRFMQNIKANMPNLTK